MPIGSLLDYPQSSPIFIFPQQSFQQGQVVGRIFHFLRQKHNTPHYVYHCKFLLYNTKMYDSLPSSFGGRKYDRDDRRGGGGRGGGG